jgi:hypothetical protein
MAPYLAISFCIQTMERGKIEFPFLLKGSVCRKIYSAEFKALPNNFTALTKEEIEQINKKRKDLPIFQSRRKESGTPALFPMNSMQMAI